MEDPLKGNVTAASTQLQERLSRVQSSAGEAEGDAGEGGSLKSWEVWQQHFQEVEEREPLLKALEVRTQTLRKTKLWEGTRTCLLLCW